MNDNRQLIDLCHKANGLDYEIQKFPDGELHFVLKSQLDHKHPVGINTRITCADELFILMQVLDICNRHGMIPDVSIFYLMGARMDRVMDFNRPFTLNVILKALGMYDANFSVLEPHNSDSILLPKWNVLRCEFTKTNADILCFPDEGAKKRNLRIMKYTDSIICSKKRDVCSGRLIGFELNVGDVDVSGRDVLVVDDLCDGGGTFCGIAPLIRKHNPKSLSLSVVHCIQKSGILKVAELYDNVYITNSYRDWQNEDLPENVKISIL